MTANGGADNDGTIFSIPVTGGTPATLFSFDGTHGDGPHGSLTLSGSTLYGMTMFGGANDDGAIFSVPVTGGTPTVLFSFGSGYAENPYGNLTLSPDGSTLYGMTYGGGANNYGTIFSIPVTGGTATSLYSFDSTHGGWPHGSLTLSGSTLYGMAIGGGTYGVGATFGVPVTGGTPTDVSSFNGTGTGDQPYGSLTLSGSTLYGMTSLGGANSDGNIFSMPAAGGTPTTIYSFAGTNGKSPRGSLTLSGSILYGMTATGGADGEGTIFALHALPGDANGDGTVDVNDLTIVLSNFGSTGRAWSQGSMDGDPRARWTSTT